MRKKIEITLMSGKGDKANFYLFVCLFEDKKKKERHMKTNWRRNRKISYFFSQLGSKSKKWDRQVIFCSIENNKKQSNIKLGGMKMLQSLSIQHDRKNATQLMSSSAEP